MIRPQRYFPWKIARQFFFTHLVFLFAILLFAGFSIRFFVYTSFLSTTNINDALGSFDNYLTSLLISILLIGIAFFLFTTKRYSEPLGRLIQRARELRRLDSVVERPEGDELTEEPGEWYDLERALNRIHKDLRTKTGALSREREELSALIGAVSDAILAVDTESLPLFFNSQFAVLFASGKGYKSLTLGEMFRSPEVLQGYRNVLQSGEKNVIDVTLHTIHHALPRYFSISVAPLRMHETGPIYGALGVFHDVTELKQAEQIRIEFVGNASHELRTPLTSIKGYVETLRDDIRQNKFDDSNRFLDVISRNVDRLIYLVNDLLDLSTLESGAEFVKAEVSTREVTDGVLKALEAKRALKRQEIQVFYGNETLLADTGRLEQVLINLVHNAIKYIPEAHKIELHWERAGEDSILRVKDNGPGIALEHHSRLFERFYRVDAGRSRDQGGTGLGLSIVKHIMIKHGGTVRLVSRPGEGTEFVCTFPS